MLLTEHRHSPRPSTLLSVHLSLGVLFDVAMTRSYFRRHGLYALGCLSIVVVILKMAILLLEEVSKRSLVYDQQLRSSLGRESTSGFWSRSLFLWLNSTLCFGFRSIMSVGDLQDLGPELGSARLFAKFQVFWEKGKLFTLRALEGSRDHLTYQEQQIRAQLIAYRESASEPSPSPSSLS